MAVFKIDVRADIQSSVKGLKLDLIEIMKQINAEPHQIKVQLDPESLQNIRSQISSVLNNINTSGSQGGGGSGSGGIRRNNHGSEDAQNERLLERIATTARRARDLLNKNIEAGSSDSWGKLNSSVVQLEETLSLCGHTASDLETALEIVGIDGTEAVARTTSAMATLQKEMQSSNTQGGFKLKDIIDTYTQINRRLNSRPDLSATSEYVDLSDRAKSFKAVIDECRGSTDRLGEALTNAGLNGARAIDEAKMLMSQFDAASVTTEKATKRTGSAVDKQAQRVKTASQAIKDYYSLLRSIGSSKDDVIRESSGWRSQSGDNARLAESLNRAEKKYMACTSAAAANNRTKEQNIELTRLEASEAEKLALELERQANSSTRAARSSKAQRALLQSTLTTTNRAADILRKYDHVQRGFHQSSKDAYEELRSAKVSLDDMRNSYKNNTANAEELSQAQDRVKTATKNAMEVFKANGEVVSSLGTRIMGLAKKFASWLGISQIIMHVVRAIRKMITNAQEIDSAMTQLKIVTNATDSEMKQFANTAIELAKNLGKSVTELTKSIETFSRLGYSLRDASELAKYATIMSNVAGVNSEEATTGLTAIVKGYDLDVSEAEHVADVLVDVGQKYAVSASEMMEAYEKSGAALHATNTSLEKSAGLIAAANASVQDASVIGTAMKTVSARIRGKIICASVHSNMHAQAQQAA